MSAGKDPLLVNKIILAEQPGGGIYTQDGQTIVNDSGQLVADITTDDLTVTGDTVIGEGGSDTMTVDSISTFEGATTFSNTVSVGEDDTGYDVKLFGATAGKSWLWDESADKMIVTGTSDLLGATQQTGTLTVGVNDTGHDVTFFGATTGKKMVWDESADQLVMDGNIQMTAGQKIASSVSNTFYPVTLDQAQQAINANGAITLTQYNTAITSVSGTGQAFTLADSTVIGQLKRIQLIVDDGDATVTFNTNATLVFDAVGDVAELIWNGADWLPIALYNCADGATAPAYTPAS